MASALNITFPGNLAQVESSTDLRRVPSTLIALGSLFLVNGLEGLFAYDPGSLAADDGTDVVRPNDKLPLQAGRWIRKIDGLASGPQGPSGPANSTYTTLALMKAAGTSNRTYNLAALSGSDEGVLNGAFTYQTGNFTGRTDVVQVDGVPLSTGALVRPATDSVITKLAASTAVLRFTKDKLGDNVSVKDFGAFGNGGNDDTVSIRNTNDYLASIGGGTANYPNGTYKVTDVITLPDRITMRGVGGHVGSVITGTHSGPIFQATSDTPGNIREYTTFEKLAFTGSGCTAIGQSSNVAYLSRLMVTDCHFYGQLAYGIDGNLIFGVIEKNTFGYYGTATTLHRHIRSRGTSTNVSNNNTVVLNRFYSALGGASVEWENGSDLDMYRNNWEQNRAEALLLKGMPSTTIYRNFFEGNQNATSEIRVAAGSALVDSSPLDIRGNTFVVFATIARLVQLDVTLSQWSLDYNTSTSLTGKQVTNDASALKSRIGNAFPGATFPSRLQQESGTWNAVDASGAVSITGTGTWERNGNHIDAEIGFTFPTNTNNGNNAVGGLPYPCLAISTGKVLSNYAGGMDVATNGGTNNVTFFAPGTITPLTNAQLSGKTIYFTIRYPAA